MISEEAVLAHSLKEKE